MTNLIMLINASYYEPERYSEIIDVINLDKITDIYKTLEFGEGEKIWYRYGKFMDLQIFINQLPEDKEQESIVKSGIDYAIKQRLINNK